MAPQGTPQPLDWQLHRGILSQLFLTERKSLKQVKVIMERDRDFPKIP